MIRFIEELSMNAWPALQTMLYDGWILRFANGYTKRANSVNPLYPSENDLEDKIPACEKLYRDKGLPVVFKMTAESVPQELDAVLAARGYQADSYTSVQLLDLHTWNEASANDASLTHLETVDWQVAFCRMNGLDGARQAVHEEMIRSIIPEKGFASVWSGSQIASVGLGVIQAGFIGLFDVVTRSDCRRQGYGERLVRGLLSWGKQQRAHMAYLQVMLNNAPALHLYEKLGFREAYQYWYRIIRM
jgi:ribosomal protein S18 acetylase RimI-like enzyme